MQCPYCDHEPYAREQDLNRHVRSKHPDEAEAFFGGTAEEPILSDGPGTTDPTAPAEDATDYPKLPEGLSAEAYQLLVRNRGKAEADRIVAEMLPPEPEAEPAEMSVEDRVARLEEALTHWFRGEQYMALEALGVSK